MHKNNLTYKVIVIKIIFLFSLNLFANNNSANSSDCRDQIITNSNRLNNLKPILEEPIKKVKEAFESDEFTETLKGDDLNLMEKVLFVALIPSSIALTTMGGSINDYIMKRNLEEVKKYSNAFSKFVQNMASKEDVDLIFQLVFKIYEEDYGDYNNFRSNPYETLSRENLTELSRVLVSKKLYCKRLGKHWNYSDGLISGWYGQTLYQEFVFKRASLGKHIVEFYAYMHILYSSVRYLHHAADSLYIDNESASLIEEEMLKAY